MPAEPPIGRADFDAYYRVAPAALAIRECVRLSAVREYDLPEPILDVGCGDGVFARLAYPTRQAWGIDINPSEVQRAQATDAYRTLICGNITEVDLPKGFFRSAIANCSLEHVPDLDGALRNIRSALSDGATFILIVPTPEWSRQLAIPELLGKLGLGRLGRAYGDALDKLFYHVHLYDESGWREHLERCGFEVIESRPLVAKSTSYAFDAMLYPSALAYAMKKFTGRWILAPGLRGLTAPMSHQLVQLLSQLATDDLSAGAGEYLLVARARPVNGS